MNTPNTNTLIKLLGKRWDILEELYQSESSNSPNELAKKLGKTLPWVSTQLNELREAGLVYFAKSKDQRLKHYHLTEQGRTIFKAIIDANPANNKNEEFEEWQISAFLDVIEDEKLSKDLRLSYAEEFLRLCQKSCSTLMKHEKVKALFLNFARNPSSDEIGTKLKSAINVTTSDWLRNTEIGDWIIKNLYPVLASHMKDTKTEEAIRIWAASNVGNIARADPNSEIKKQAEKSIIDTYFLSDIAIESEMAKELQQQLAWLTSKSLFEKIKTKAESEDLTIKIKAETLLKEMKKLLLSRPVSAQIEEKIK